MIETGNQNKIISHNLHHRRPNNQLPEGGKDEPFAWEAREFLRKLVVGKTVLGSVVHTANNRFYSSYAAFTSIGKSIKITAKGT